MAPVAVQRDFPMREIKGKDMLKNEDVLAWERGEWFAKDERPE